MDRLATILLVRSHRGNVVVRPGPRAGMPRCPPNRCEVLGDAFAGLAVPAAGPLLDPGAGATLTDLDPASVVVSALGAPGATHSVEDLLAHLDQPAEAPGGCG